MENKNLSVIMSILWYNIHHKESIYWCIMQWIYKERNMLFHKEFDLKLLKGVDHQRTILSLVHKYITPMNSYLIIYNTWLEFVKFSSYTANTIQKFHSILTLDYVSSTYLKIAIVLFKTLILVSVPHLIIITNIEWLPGFK